MLHATGRARFATKSQLRSIVADKSLTQNLDGDRPINQQVCRAINRTHPAAAQPFVEPVFLVKNAVQQWIDWNIGNRSVGLERRLVGRAYEHIV
jgi:hypothetical protein